MQRREFITLLGGVAVTWPLGARAQQPVTPVIGFLSSRAPAESAYLVAAFRQGLKEAGFVEDQNVHIAFRWAEGQSERPPGLASELIQIQVAVILASGGTETGLAAKAATATIPIVAIGSDPDRVGLVASLNRPGGNVTGISPMAWPLDAKRLEILHELVPTADVIAMLINPKSPEAEIELREIQVAARAIGQQLHILNASSERDIDAAFASLVQHKDGALLVAGDAFFASRGNQLVALAALHAVPTIYFERQLVAAGGLISYASSVTEAYRQAAIYVSRILRGRNLPIYRSFSQRNLS